MLGTLVVSVKHVVLGADEEFLIETDSKLMRGRDDDLINEFGLVTAFNHVFQHRLTHEVSQYLIWEPF